MDMKKRIHLFEEYDVVERLLRPYYEASRYDSNYHIAKMDNWVTTEHGGTGYACFDFTVPYPEDKRFDGTPLVQYLPDKPGEWWVYRRANHIENTPAYGSAERANNWVKARWLEHGVPGFWECLICGYSTAGETDPAKFPEQHVKAKHGAAAADRVFPRIIAPTPPQPPLPIGTFYARRRQAEGDQWVVCQISPEPYFPWSEKILSVHESKQEARQELVRLVMGK
jgi:hypothetical protein